MHISVTCPRCQTHYQLDPGLRGKMMRCPSNMCRQVFEVKDDAELPKSGDLPKAPPAVAGGVGDVVPILTAEAITQEVPAPPPPPPKEDKPPVRTATSKPVADVPVAPKPPPPRREREAKPAVVKESTSDSLLALEAALSESGETAVVEERIKSWEPPPVRGSRTSTLAAATVGRPIAIGPAESTGARRKRRIGRVVILLAGLLIASGSGFFYLSRGRQASHEAEYLRKAEKLYEEREFGDAAQLLQKLHRQFPESPEVKHYRFLAELSDVREAVYHPRGDADEAAKTHDRLRQFLTVYQNDPLLEKYKKDIEHSLLRIGEELVGLANQKQERTLLQRAQNALAQAGQFKTTSGPAMDLQRKIESELPRVETAIAEFERRRGIVDGLRTLAEQPSSFAVRAARSLVQRSGMQGDAEVTKLLQGLVTSHAASVTYTPSFRKARSTDISEPSLSAFVVPLLGKMQPAPIAEPDVVVSLARGVLYALDARTGSLAWAKRVGADTTVPPVRLPATGISPPCYLVTSTDPNALTAVEAERGKVLWQQILEDSPVGTPVLVGKHAFVATASGKVLEIETTEGTLLGHFTLGQALTVGGVQEPGSSRVYFPADSFSVFILDVAQRNCAGLLYSGHEPGSLKCEPFVLLDPDPAPAKEGVTGATGWLVLTDVVNHDSRFRVFQLPVQHPDQTSVPLDVKTKGWTRFGPVHDRDRVALATDAGHFGLWGVRAKGNRDPVMFPLVGSEFVFSKAGHGGAAAVAHSQGEDFWVITRERLHRLARRFSPEAGPALKAQWRETPQLGDPLHRVETRVSRTGRTILYITGQAADVPVCVVSAVDADDGSVYWRRQLGTVALADPVAGTDAIWMWDANGVIRVRGSDSNLSLRLAEGERVHLLADEKGERILALIEESKKLSVRVVELSKSESRKSFSLSSACSGTPALGKSAIVLPAADGILTRLPLGDGLPAQGPSWRGVGVDSRTLAHVVAMGDNDFAVTDGGSGLQLVHWAEPKVWESRATVQLPRRIIAPPAVLAGATPRIAVADSADTVTLLGERLSVLRQWSLGAKITEGPFARGPHIGCVVAGNRLVWLDPGKATPAWEYTFVAPIVGQPRLINGQLIAADLAGNVIALDPTSGELIVEVYRLAANVAPAATPLFYGLDYLFIPLTDGTVLFVSYQTSP